MTFLLSFLSKTTSNFLSSFSSASKFKIISSNYLFSSNYAITLYNYILYFPYWFLPDEIFLMNFFTSYWKIYVNFISFLIVFMYSNIYKSDFLIFFSVISCYTYPFISFSFWLASRAKSSITFKINIKLLRKLQSLLRFLIGKWR